MSIPMTKVESSLIEEIGHDPATSTLRVRFKPSKKEPQGPVYDYAGFSAEDYEAFQGAESVGRHFLQNIKGKFVHSKPEEVA